MEERHISFSSSSTEFGAKLVRVPTPYAFEDEKKRCGVCGIKRWCRRMKQRFSRS